MKPASLKMALVFAGAILFNIVFWKEKMAVNVVFFDLFVLGAVFVLYRPGFKEPLSPWLLLAHLVTLVTLVVHNTELSKFAFAVTLLLLIVFSQHRHRSLWYAGATALMNYLLVIPSFLSGMKQVEKAPANFYKAKRAIRFIVIPLIMLFVFALLYNFSNAVFREMLAMIGNAITRFFSRFFDWFSWGRFWFLMLGLFVTAGLLLKTPAGLFSKKDEACTDELTRKKNDLKKWKQHPLYDLLSLLMGRFANGILALRNENTVGIISLFLLNALLFFINWLDIEFVWFGFTYDKNINLSAYVHEGAGLLIFSIVLAMLVLLFFFRGNLNFYRKNKWLKRGAYLWIIQNTVLVGSVLLRDYYYIHEFGLAYKRIGVLVFLCLVLAGLVSVAIKISRLRTNYFLLRVNAWVVLTVLVLSSCIHWDATIAGYNIARKSTLPLDVKFLLSLSDKALPVIEKNQDILDRPLVINPENDEGSIYYRSGFSPRQYFEKRKADFFSQQKEYSWLSWNMTDSYVKEQLQQSFTHTVSHR